LVGYVFTFEYPTRTRARRSLVWSSVFIVCWRSNTVLLIETLEWSRAHRFVGHYVLTPRLTCGVGCSAFFIAKPDKYPRSWGQLLFFAKPDKCPLLMCRLCDTARVIRLAYGLLLC